ncbi:hypothetical protein MMC13_003786 [Lambiella insularis]|nr:hypothetical protein [Lambiella insularis]
MRLQAVLLLLFASLTAAQDNSTFYNPPAPDATVDWSNNPVYQVGSTVQVRWAVTWDRVSLCLFQNGAPQHDYEFLLPNASNTNNYDWIALTTKNISSQSGVLGNVFSLYAFEPGTFTYFQSHFFNLTTNAVPSASTPIATAAIVPTTMAVVTTSSTPPSMLPSGVLSDGHGGQGSSTATATSTGAAATSQGFHHHSNDGGDNDLGTMEKVGLGVGIGVGVPLFIAIGIMTGWVLRACFRRKRARAIVKPKMLPWKSVEKPKAFKKTPISKVPISSPMPLPMHELSGPTFVYELPQQPFSRSTMGTTAAPIPPLSRSIIGASMGGSISASSTGDSSTYSNTRGETFMRDSVSSMSTREF